MEDRKMNMHRRNFVRALSLGTAHLLFSNTLYAGQSRYASSNPLQKVKLGKSGLETTLLGIGTGVHAGNRTAFLTRQDKNKSLDLLYHTYHKGIRFFDCADSYGTHGIVAEAMKKMDREQITLSSKIWVRGGGIPEPERPDADIVVDRFRKELNTDYIDLVQIHCMVEENWTETQKKQMDILENLKAKGIIKAHGVSVHSLEAMEDAANSPWVDVIHVRINPYGIAMDKPEPEQVVKVINKLHSAGKGVIGMKLVGNGKLRDQSDKIDHALRFVLGLETVDMMIIGFEENKQIDNYLARTTNALKELRG
ncbi:Aldo/keto reductase family protein [Mariniphaga anaerophila]|uniref:Aldo/keto reductase family protein n=1 Tax=Mariniphaga anaerophila TaxID=1484053 RepID=A0A1M4W0B9_9BACT|nr:aldo/keto reductase [Mariniphaga anaerophila]SHE74659.1 Aldo/keto reductase family protein [Mariniphaga anaerophila]